MPGPNAARRFAAPIAVDNLSPLGPELGLIAKEIGPSPSAADGENGWVLKERYRLGRYPLADRRGCFFLPIPGVAILT